MSNSRVAPAGGEFYHSIPLQLRFNDVDLFGHVNNTVYLEFFDLGKLRYFEKVLGTEFVNSGFVTVIVNINCNFYAPSFLNESLMVLTRVANMGEKSLTLEQRIINIETEEVKCSAMTIMSGFDPESMSSAPLPDFARSAINSFERN